MTIEEPGQQPEAAPLPQPIAVRRRARRRPRPERSVKTTILLGLIVLTPIAAIPAYGYYTNIIEPMQIKMVKVNDTLFRMEDYVERMRFLEVESQAAGRKVDFGSDPFRMLDEMRDDELIRQGSPRMGVTASEQEVTNAIKERLAALPREGEQTTPEELERNFKELYKQHLSEVNLTDEKYRKLMQANVLRRKLREALSDRVPSVAEHAHVMGIKVDEVQQTDDVKKRLAGGEDFGVVARAISTDFDSKENRGDLGWMPRRALDRQLDAAAFEVPLNETSEPIFVDRGFWIIRVLGREVRNVEGKAKEKLKDRALLDWLEEERKANTVEVYFDSDRYAYVIDEVRKYRRPTAPQQQQQPGQPQ